MGMIIAPDMHTGGYSDRTIKQPVKARDRRKRDHANNIFFYVENIYSIFGQIMKGEIPPK